MSLNNLKICEFFKENAHLHKDLNKFLNNIKEGEQKINNLENSLRDKYKKYIKSSEESIFSLISRKQ